MMEQMGIDPEAFQEKEMKIRKIFHDKLLRGKIEATFIFENEEGGENYSINTSIFKQYYNQLLQLAQELNISHDDLLPAILRLPEVVSSSDQPVSDEEWQLIKVALDQAIEHLINHRLEEGKSAEADLPIIPRMKRRPPVGGDPIHDGRGRLPDP